MKKLLLLMICCRVISSYGQATDTSSRLAGTYLKDWSVITLMAGTGTSVNGQVITGNGWQITLNPGWKMVKTDELHFRLSQ